MKRNLLSLLLVVSLLLVNPYATTTSYAYVYGSTSNFTSSERLPVGGILKINYETSEDALKDICIKDLSTPNIVNISQAKDVYYIKDSYTELSITGNILKIKALKEGSSTWHLHGVCIDDSDADAYITLTITVYNKSDVTPAKPSIKLKRSSNRKQLKVNVKSVKNPSGNFESSLTTSKLKVSYQIKYSTNKNFKKAKTKTFTISKGKSKNITLKKLNKKKKYYVMARTYTVFRNQKFYSKWTAKKSVK